jgi:hypothetical protein
VRPMPWMVGVVVSPLLLGVVGLRAQEASKEPIVSEAEADEGWPRQVATPEATVLLYQPQISRLTADDVEARAAVQVTIPGGPEPHFGAVWITARVDIDRDARVVSFRDIRIPNVRSPDGSDEDKQKLAALLEREMPKWALEMSLDRFIPLLELSDHDERTETGLRNDPPKIVVSTEPATLVVIDGEPRRQAVSEPTEAARAGLERVVNTPVVLVFDPKAKAWFLAGGGDLWYTAADVLGPYTVASKVPKAVKALTPKSDQEKAATADGKPPRIIVATEPTELIVVAGDPQYAPLGDTDLLSLTNSDRDVIVEMATRKHFVLLSGRWYASEKELEGPWRYVAPADLPAAFAEIPADSDRGHVRAQVPGTVEAQEALLDNSIPQTAAIRRDDHSFKAEYDGAPRFEDVEETKIQYAVNTPQSIFKVGARYYACDQGVWYESGAATGPWSVATEVPAALYDIPPSSPHHNVTYVRVYEVTPQVVHVGYTPGYLGSYVQGGCVVYGTGWYYPGWYGRVYYPRPYTWGFGATYSPWYGWGFGIGWSSGPLTISIGIGGPAWGHPGWWGPWGWRPYYPPFRPPYYPGYRPPYYPGYRPPHYPGYRPPPGRPPSAVPRPGTPATLPSGAQARPNNLYARDRNAVRNVPRPSTTGMRPTPTTGRPDNVLTDRSGNVYRPGAGGGWEQRQGGSWQPSSGGSPSTSRPSTRPSRPQGGSPSGPATRPSGPGNLNRDWGARQRGVDRSRSAPRPTPRGRPAGGARRR